MPHKDKFNCTWEQYDVTGAFCIIGIDTKGTIWSLKIIANSRSPIGKWYDRTFTPNTSVLTACLGYLVSVNKAYTDFLQSYTGGNPMVSLDALIPEEFFLDKHCPWTEEAGVKSLKLPTAVTRTFWMSPAIHRLRQFRRVLTVDVVLEMILLSSYQISWSQYWVVTEQMLSLEFNMDYLS